MTSVFVHIPKTAGTSIRELLASQLGDDLIHVSGGFHDTRALDRWCARPDRLTPRSVLFGHVPYGIHERLRVRCEYFTVLRDPVDRAVSAYSYVKGNPRNYLHDATQQLSFHDFLARRLDTSMDNAQVRYIAGIGGHRALTDRDLERAVALLRTRYALVGLYERLDAFVDALLYRLLGGRPMDYRTLGWYKRSADRPRGDAIPADWVTAVKAAFPLDCLLYQQVREQYLVQEGEPE